MATFTIPTIYTAVDKFSAPLKAMERANASFGTRLEQTTARSERLFRKLTPGLGDATKQMLSFASSAAIAGAAIGTAVFSVKSITEYETAVQSFRTIVSDLSDNEFSKYQTAIDSVAKETKKSSIDVAKSFEKIAGLNAKFAETSEGISAVSAAAITLSKASRDDLGKSAENLVGIMNQFSYSADKADKTINVLAAGQAVGAASITQTAEAFTTFGSVAAGANITLEESVGLVETLGKFSIFGAEAGTQLKGSIIHLQKAGLGYKSGLFNINDALAEAKKKFDTLKTAKEKDAYVTNTFGLINLGAGRILLNNIDTYKKYTEGVTGTTEAQKAAEINSSTLAEKLDQLKNRWINMLTSSDGAGAALDRVKKIIGFVTDNLDTILNAGLNVVKFFVLWKSTIIASRIALFGYNVVLGISNALSATASIAVGRNAVALSAYNAVVWLAEAAQWAWNVAMTANPIGLVILAVTALVAGIVWLVSQIDNWGEIWEHTTAFMGYAIDTFAYGFKTAWAAISDAFLTAVDGMVLAWKWAQNQMGNLSDAQYAKDKSRIMKESLERKNAIIENAKLTQLSAIRSAQEYNKINFKLKKDEPETPGLTALQESQQRQNKIAALNSEINNSIKSDLGISNTEQKKLINPEEAKTKAIANNMELNLTVNNSANGETTVDANGKKMSSSNGAFNLKPNISSTQK